MAQKESCMVVTEEMIAMIIAIQSSLVSKGAEEKSIVDIRERRG